ncbi:MAG: alanine:cation symporter family protein [Gammaproteobacteria bacterium]|nr:alanine:cation symporter family protein [Gammaproteobacteria bacterium]MBU1555474.1 alanine:cation symporter family protein [Gammaproteobacteria bacterium]MBU2072511.1 alanine:cation symporter family protein [Gammaproteobacteria bacterium]MBU2181939.1 alanine:cation symporter family protein [Gammaproteobacteria bacterium]MBU2204245.1 alanine:cation symporter family protein [Gammaproteobacteria bacterium]
MTTAFSFSQAFESLTNYLAGVVFYAFDINGVSIPLVLIWLVCGAVIFTCYLGFINVRGFGHAIRLLKNNKRTGAKGEITPFQALSTALSGTVGTGNIAGVAVAISLGGPGATFWMIVAGLLGMSTKFVECTLAVKYRQLNADGSVSGGPMYYIKAALDKCNLPLTGTVLAMAFSVFVIFGSAGFVHVNQGFVQVKTVTGFANPWLFGAIYAALVAAVIIGGIKSIARVTSMLVPLMCAVYLLASLCVMAAHASAIPSALLLIVQSAFSPEAGYGGLIGVLIQGFRRAAYSNEAGIGSSPIAHAAAQTDQPVKQGFVALLEPFIDTVVICTITALVIILTGAYQTPGLDGVQITSGAFASIFSWFPWVLMVALLLFGFSTVISWSYYGLTGWRYLVGQDKRLTQLYKVLFCFIVSVGAVPNIMAVFDFIDSMIFLMAVPNILALYLLLPEVKADLRAYWKTTQAA